ncbi:hypothetical protein EVAR_7578_1, partial [Eumeta japonica]
IVYLVCESVMCPVVLWQTRSSLSRNPDSRSLHSQNTQKSPQSSNGPSQIASLPTTYRTALAIYEDWGLDCLTNKKQMPRFKAIAPWRFQCTHGRDDNRGTKTHSRLQSISPTSNHLGSFLLDFCEQHNLVISSTWGRRSCKNPLDWNQLIEILRSSVREHLKFNKTNRNQQTRSSKIYEGKILEEQVSQRSCRYRTSGRQERTTGPTRKKRMRNVNTFSHRCTKFVDPNE